MGIKTPSWISLCLLLLSCVLSAGAETGRLKMVIIVTRHGVRSPTGGKTQLNQYSSQPWPEWDVAPGYLTPQGARLMTIAEPD